MILPVLLLGILTGVAGRSEQLRVAVCADRGLTASGDAVQIRFAARDAVKIFSKIEVQLDWAVAPGCSSTPGTIAVSFKRGTDAEWHPSTLAYAFPFQQPRIVVLYDRVAESAQKRCLSINRLLAYVLVHEITHVLEAVDHHSATGIMKANWTLDDNFLMRTSALDFATEDVDLIFQAAKARETKPLISSEPGKAAVSH